MAKKYTAQTLRKKLERYFDGISYMQPLMQDIWTGRLDGYGHKIYDEQPIINQACEEIQVLRWAELPSLTAICLMLGVNRSTWARWAADEQLGPVVEWARATVEHAWEGRLAGKATQGVIFNLTHNFGWTERKEIALDAETRRAMKQAAMSTEEKEQLLRELMEAATNGSGQGADGGAVVAELAGDE